MRFGRTDTNDSLGPSGLILGNDEFHAARKCPRQLIEFTEKGENVRGMNPESVLQGGAFSDDSFNSGQLNFASLEKSEIALTEEKCHFILYFLFPPNSKNVYRGRS